MSDEEDPFDRLRDETEDRDGNPFDQLDDVPDEGTVETDPTTDTAFTEISDPGVGVSSESASTDRGQIESGPSGDREQLISPGRETDPFADIGQRSGDPFESMTSAFEAMDVTGIDPDQIWERLENPEAGTSGETRTRTYAEVSKHRFCKGCEHFSAPPDIRCTHEGTQIVEFLDMETVRLVDCPVVAERRELEKRE